MELWGGKKVIFSPKGNRGEVEYGNVLKTKSSGQRAVFSAGITQRLAQGLRNRLDDAGRKKNRVPRKRYSESRRGTAFSKKTNRSRANT